MIRKCECTEANIIPTSNNGRKVTYERLPRVYIIGPYRADTRDGVRTNIEAARKAALELWKDGFAVLCAHMNSAEMDFDSNISSDVFLNGGLTWLYFSEVAYCISGWKNSEGSLQEIAFCEQEQIPVFYRMRDIKKWKKKKWEPCR